MNFMRTDNCTCVHLLIQILIIPNELRKDYRHILLFPICNYKLDIYYYIYVFRLITASLRYKNLLIFLLQNLIVSIYI